MTSHGIIQPNPALYDLESWRPRHVLAHETGQEVGESLLTDEVVTRNRA